MGGAYGRNLIKGGVEVIGVDPAEAARDRLTAAGGQAHAEPGPWIAECDLVILSLISPAILDEVTTQLAGLLAEGQVVLETGTFAMKDKLAARDKIGFAGATLLDCPVSGTGAQANVADLVMMASGPAAGIAHAMPYIKHFTRAVIEAGEFGAGIQLKYVANHAVALHNTAAAEVLNYADALGLDRDTVYKLLSTGAGQSKMLDLRMPLMMAHDYDPPTASLKMFEKDISVIGADLKRLGVQAPLFDVVEGLYTTAIQDLPEQYDAAAVFEVYRSGKAR
ncbi:2-hydroxy-3-oxopropionate reductase [Flavimaricola marinus]|uniref:2-hydroxy-3-oxopropionate reductase n=2 Tax=Flavimaricola marinus TaxID=1819565 RepID=A0A238LF35_9RHOB|nr:2-hydroxy-3-oxopropionate reductase [Flavimaricola marinus]